ncbi:hypothetical protein DYB32_010521 [Aphanomyces invadans]|uniref:Uncharacterized protein n=1 Tax=Aphanomyces invadans TaxID=157072 RepID=A0A3R7CSQ9_9STRA|nr:hypothetical protein DYB32_010521 [Aphanomyces invadans]
MRFAKVAPDGSFSKPPMDKLVYFTMVKIRVLVAVNQVLNYENQQLTLFPLIGLAYASYFAYRGLDAMYKQVAEQVDQGDMGLGTKDVLVQQHASFLLKCLHNPVPLSSGTSLDMLGFLQANPHAKCPARQSSDVRNPQLLLDAFQVRALQLLLRADAHKSSLHHLTQASLAHAESIVLACFYDGVVAIADASLQAAMLQLWTLYGLWRLNANLGEFRMDDHLSSAQGAWVQDELLALLAVVRPNAIALVDGFGMSDFELNSTIGRYDGDIYRALIARAATEPLNQTDVVPGYHQFLQPLLTAKL